MEGRNNSGLDNKVEICRVVVNEFYNKQEGFSFGELQTEVVKRGGILIYDIGYTLGKKIRDDFEEGKLIFNAGENKYYYSKSLIE